MTVKAHVPFQDGSKHAANEYCPTCHGQMDPLLWNVEGQYIGQQWAPDYDRLAVDFRKYIASTRLAEARYLERIKELEEKLGPWVYQDRPMRHGDTIQDRDGKLWIIYPFPLTTD